MVRRKRVAALGTVTAAALLVPPMAAADAAPADRPSQRLQRAVTLDGTLRHVRNLQKVADVSGANRAAGTSGHFGSAGYVAGQLEAAGYDVTLDPFSFPFFTERSAAVLARTAPQPKTYVPEEDYATLQFSASGDVTAAVTPVDVQLPPGPLPSSSTSGCEAADFARFRRGNIALIQRGTCTFAVKAENAQAAGAVAVIVFNEGQPGRTGTVAGTLGGTTVNIPVVGTSFAVGQELARRGTRARVRTDTLRENRSTYNVIAETPGGRADNVVVVGSHLDSVVEGPGINDNGSGSAAQLEVAVQFAKTVKNPRNKVRFAWWSAEESGLLGSEDYVSRLSPTQLGDIALYLNFDMVASPNYVRFLYDGDNSDNVGAGPGPQGSAAIEDVFEAHFAARKLPTEGTDFDGRSDYGPFIAAGIPAGGIFTGAEGIKTPAQQQRYGGTAGVAFDPCYHQACDTSRNINRTALDQNSDAIADAVARFAFDTSAVNDRPRRAATVSKAQVRSYDVHDGR